MTNLHAPTYSNVNKLDNDTQLSTQKRGRSKEKEINRTDHRCMRGEQKPKPYNQLNVHVF
jgi:hypothetical protein